ncbi:MAG TPA: hypothetical protein VGI74_14325 [Streptosporangiaceae bacterium]|jgi:hypothetical protein
MQNLRQLSPSELAQLIHCVSALAAMKRGLPADLYIKLDTYLADLLAEQEDRAAQQTPAHAHDGHCLCLCG